jgi:hypothetical protein
MKFKPKKRDTYLCIGYKEEISEAGNPKGSLGAIILSSGDSEFSVGTGFTYEQRQRLWADRNKLVGKQVTISYQHILPSGTPRHSVFTEVIW